MDNHRVKPYEVKPLSLVWFVREGIYALGRAWDVLKGLK